MKTTIVTTTIRVPHLLLDYAANAEKHGRDLDFIVIGDRKTPPDAQLFCQTRLQRCQYYDVLDQINLADELGELFAHLPWNSLSRRNIGMYLAYKQKSDVIITIDDDNFLADPECCDFVGTHGLAGQTTDILAWTTQNGWYNICEDLREENGQRFYPRGYPQNMRWTREFFPGRWWGPQHVAVNAGLWLGDPDIDAVQRLHRPLNVREYTGGRFALAPGIWSPFNSQNTAMKRDVIPAYFLSPHLGRFDDIWASYVVQRIAQHLKEVVAFGPPLVRQDRNEHDLFDDLQKEITGMSMTDHLCKFLREIKLTGSNYRECFGEIACALWEGWGDWNWSVSQRNARSQWIWGMKIWHRLFERTP